MQQLALVRICWAICACGQLALTSCSAAAGRDAEREQAGVWKDPSSSRVWQEPQFPERKTWFDAQAACDALELSGYDDWRLPTLNELRSAARDCPATITGGSCGVTDECLETGCYSSACDGCSEFGGHGADGCYRPGAFTGDCMTTWTSSVPPDLPTEVWTVGFGGCHVLTYPQSMALNTRCIREGAD